MQVINSVPSAQFITSADTRMAEKPRFQGQQLSNQSKFFSKASSLVRKIGIESEMIT